MFKTIRYFLFFIFMVGFLLPPSAGAKGKEEKEKTPISMLRAIEQRNTELDQKAKQLELKDYRLRILEQEVSENLKKMKSIRDEMARIRAEQKAAEVKRVAEAKAAEVKRVAEAKAAAAKKIAEEKAAAARKAAEASMAILKKAEEKKVSTVIDKRLEEEKALARKKAEEEEELLRRKEEERRALQAQQFSKLAKIYETMPPEDAALRIQNMKDDFALAIIPLMKPKKASKVLSAMDPFVAAKFTEKMAIRESFAGAVPPASGKKDRR